MGGVTENLLRTGDIVVFIGTRPGKRPMRLYSNEEPENEEYDLPMFIIDIFDQKFVLRVGEETVELVPYAHIFNEVKHVIRNWHFDTAMGIELIGRNIIGHFTTKDYPKTIASKLREDGGNIAAKFILSVCGTLGIKIPMSLEDVDENFDTSLMLQFGSAFYKAAII